MSTGTAALEEDAREAAVGCTHCGQHVPLGLRAPDDGPQFCCSGCRTVYQILGASGLDAFYRMREAGGVLRPEAQGPAPAGDGVEDYDGPAFREAFVHPREDGCCELDWHVGGMHCAACVWLLEQLPRIAPGVHAARVDFAASRLRVRYDPQRIGPAEQARRLAGLGYRAHPWGDRRASDAARAERRSWMLRFVVAAASAMSTMHLTFTLFAGRETGDMSLTATRGFGLAALAIALPALSYGAWPFYRAAVAGFRFGRATIEQSVLLVIVLGVALSLYNVVRGVPEVYADALSMFVAFLLGGRLALVTAREQVAGGGASMHGLLPPEARRRHRDGTFEPVVPDQLQAGDVVAVRPSELLPADGVIIAGDGELDVAVLTGEPRPLRVEIGDRVHAGCRLIGGALELRCESAGSASRMGRLLEAVRSGSWLPTPRSQLVDRVSTWYAPAVAVLAIATWMLWRELDPSRALDQAMALVLACCPCALGLATPLAYALAVRRAAATGLVIQDGGAVEILAAPRHVVLDKTGTLTAGRFQVVAWTWLAELEQSEQQAIEAAVLAAERRSRHPIGLALSGWLAARGVEPVPVADFVEHLGQGLACESAAGQLRIGSPAWVAERAGDAAHTEGLEGAEQIAIRSPAEPPWLRSASRASSVIGISRGDRMVAQIALRDPLKPGADDLVAACRASGASLHLCSGDDPAVCATVAAELGIDPSQVHGGQSPEAKAERVAALAREGATVMIGDGLNDRLALEAAHVGIGLRGGMEAVMACCQIYVADQSPQALPRLLAGARSTTRVLRRALVASLLYNLVAVAAVVAGFWGPYVCAIAMPASSLLTILYLTRSRCFR